MFVEFYKLAEQPFGVTPNPRYLYLTPTHREAMASIVYGVMENRGFTALIAPPGMGKTTLLFDLLQRCGQQIRTVFLFQFQPSPEGLLRSLLTELGIPDEGQNFVEMQEKLNQAILAEAKQGRKVVVIVDEAQNFREPVLEVLRMLSNFETIQEKLIHIVLSGQPQLAEMLTAPSIKQLRQRISIIATLQPLDATQTHAYIQHRLRVAGYASTRPPLFDEAACQLIAQYSGGIPRTINNLCFNALSLGCSLKRPTIGPAVVNEVIGDLDLAPILQPKPTLGNVPMPQVPRIPLSSAEWPPKREAGRGLRFFAGVAVFIAAVSIGGVLANQRLSLPAATGAAPPAPRPPAVQEDALTRAVVDDAPSQPEAPLATPSSEKVDAESEMKAVPAKVPVHRQSTERVKLVTAPSPDTLYGLCLKNMSDCSPLMLARIRELNPDLKNAKYLVAGEKVRMPLETRDEFSSVTERRRNPRHTVKFGENR